MSGEQYDIETFRDDILAIVQANLGTKITAINAEKNDGITITDIASENYYNDMSDQVFNISPFILYYLVNLESKTIGAMTQTLITMQMSVVFDNTNQVNTESKVLRYSRCLKEVIQENFKKSASASALNIEQFLPVDLRLNQGSDFKMGGIHVTATIFG